jgi:hypothetical protein
MNLNATLTGNFVFDLKTNGSKLLKKNKHLFDTNKVCEQINVVKF